MSLDFNNISADVYTISTKDLVRYITLIWNRLKKSKGGPKISILILGPPGVGKSEMIQQYAMKRAQELAAEKKMKFAIWQKGMTFDPGTYYYVMYTGDFMKTLATRIGYKYRTNFFVLVDLRLGTLEPSDLLGVPYKTEYASPDGEKIMINEFLPPGSMRILEDGDGVLFLDEFTNITRQDVWSLAQQLVLDRRIGDISLSPQVELIAAGNTSETSNLATPLPTPIANRFIIISLNKEPDLDTWISFINTKYDVVDMYDEVEPKGNKPVFNRSIIEFLTKQENRGYFYMPPADSTTFAPWPSPRSWEKAGLFTDEELKEIAPAILGPAAGGALIKFIQENRGKGLDALERKLRNEPLGIGVKNSWTTLPSDDKIRYIKAIISANSTEPKYPFTLMNSLLLSPELDRSIEVPDIDGAKIIAQYVKLILTPNNGTIPEDKRKTFIQDFINGASNDNR